MNRKSSWETLLMKEHKASIKESTAWITKRKVLEFHTSRAWRFMEFRKTNASCSRPLFSRWNSPSHQDSFQKNGGMAINCPQKVNLVWYWRTETTCDRTNLCCKWLLWWTKCWERLALIWSSRFTSVSPQVAKTDLWSSLKALKPFKKPDNSQRIWLLWVQRTHPHRRNKRKS